MSGTSRLSLIAAVLLVGSNAWADKAPSAAKIAEGKAVFEHTCQPCHGFGVGDDGRALLPAPHALSLKYHGSVSPYLERRSDLSYPVLLTFVRHGTWSMPAFRKTEITDAQVEAVAAYLADSAKKANHP